MRLQDIMNREVETVSPGDTTVFANDVMWRKRIHHLVVMEEDEVVGILSDTDLGGPEATEIPDGQQVFQVMTKDIVTATPEMLVDRAINIFRERRISCLPVLDGDRLVGIVTTTDIDNLAKRGTSNHKVEGRDTQAYPPLNVTLGKTTNKAGHE